MEDKREKVYHIRLNDEESKTVEELRKVYGFRSAADLFRHAIGHIDRTRPTLGRKFKPQKGEEVQGEE